MLQVGKWYKPKTGYAGIIGKLSAPPGTDGHSFPCYEHLRFFSDSKIWVYNSDKTWFAGWDAEAIEEVNMIDYIKWLPDGHPEKAIKDKFVVGKWYTHPVWSEGSYAKYDLKRDRDSFYFNESIRGNAHKYERNWWMTDERMVEADMTEVSKYLPEGHPDKITKSKFEVGKWYKYNGWYIKFKSYSGGVFRSSEDIDRSGRYRSCGGTFGGEDADPQRILLTDLSEIQQFLPDGHPDKQLVLTVGKWYRKKNDPRVIAKLTSSYDYALNRFPSCTYMANDIYYASGSHFTYWFPNDLEEVPQEVLDSRLPVGHPEKSDFRTKPFYPEYARCICDDLKYIKKGEVCRVDDHGLILFYKNSQPDWYKYVSGQFEPATAEDFFRVGSPTTNKKGISDKVISIEETVSTKVDDYFLKSTTAKTKNEHVIHQDPVLIGTRKKNKQLFII